MNGVKWNHNTPISRQFDDIYFNPENGRSESEFVFLKGIGLEELLQSKKDYISICELGFGTGLNFFLTWEEHKRVSPDKNLIFFSIEKYPLPKEDILRALAGLVDEKILASFSQQYRYIYPGLHVFRFGVVQLRLFIGDVIDGLNSIWGPVDAYYLDGFAPAKNPEMWSSHVFEKMASLSASNAKVATFTSAGFVRRGLQEAGFFMQKSPGFGNKRERLIGSFASSNKNKSHWTFPKALYQKTIIAGAGLAGSSLALFLNKNKFSVKVYDPTGIASGSSGNPIGLVSPPAFRGYSPMSEYFLQGYFMTLRFLENHFPDCIFDRGLQITSTEKGIYAREKLLKSREFMPWLFSSKNDQLWIESAMVISPKKLVCAMLDHFYLHQKMAPFFDDSNFIYANGYKIGSHLPKTRIRASRGQINWLSLSKPIELNNQLNEFYTVQWKENQKNFLGIGASYEYSTDTTFRLEEAKTMVQSSVIPNSMSDLSWEGRASIRPVSHDRMPLIGPVSSSRLENGIESQYILGGSGSRGLIALPLGAELICDIMNGMPPGVSPFVWRFIEPGRFDLRKSDLN